MALGLPSVNIVFKQEGTTAIQRGDSSHAFLFKNNVYTW